MLKRIKSVALCAVLAFSVLATGCTKDLETKVTEKNVNGIVSDYTQVYKYYNKLREDILSIDKLRQKGTGCTKDLETKVTEKNVNGIVSDYTQVYKYYNKLREDILSIDKLRQKGGSEKTATNLTNNIEKNLTKVKALEYKYDNLYQAQKYLEKCYKDVKKASEGAIGNHSKYDKNIVKFKGNFGEFKKYMALARTDISKVRGTSEFEDSTMMDESTDNTSTEATEPETEEKDAKKKMQMI